MTTGLPPTLDLRRRGEGAVTRTWRESHVQVAPLAGTVVWSRGIADLR